MKLEEAPLIFVLLELMQKVASSTTSNVWSCGVRRKDSMKRWPSWLAPSGECWVGWVLPLLGGGSHLGGIGALQTIVGVMMLFHPQSALLSLTTCPPLILVRLRFAVVSGCCMAPAHPTSASAARKLLSLAALRTSWA